jgi:serine/threonine protein kinase
MLCDFGISRLEGEYSKSNTHGATLYPFATPFTYACIDRTWYLKCIVVDAPTAMGTTGFNAPEVISLFFSILSSQHRREVSELSGFATTVSPKFLFFSALFADQSGLLETKHARQ